MKRMDIIFHMMPMSDSQVFWTPQPDKVEHFSPKMLKTNPFLLALKTCFFAHLLRKLSFEDRLRFLHESNCKGQQLSSIFSEREQSQPTFIHFRDIET